MSDLRHSSGAEGGEASPGDKLQAKLGEGSEDSTGSSQRRATGAELSVSCTG